MLESLLPILGAGLLVVGALLFWAAIQNWMADLIHRMSEKLGALTHTVQSALVILDRVMVNGQRFFVATARAFFRREETQESVEIEEVKTVRREDLPVDVREKLERGESLQYELSVGSMKVQPKHVTYRLVVRRAE